MDVSIKKRVRREKGTGGAEPSRGAAGAARAAVAPAAPSRSWNAYDPDCPTRLLLDRIADKWTVLVVGALAERTLRFGELRRQVGGISQKVLTEILRGLERDGVVTRTVYASVPPKVEYSLTALGKNLTALLDSVREWAETNMDAVLRAQAAHDSAARAFSLDSPGRRP